MRNLVTGWIFKPLKFVESLSNLRPPYLSNFLDFIANRSYSRVIGILCLFALLIVLLVTHNALHIADRMFWLDEVDTYNRAIQPFWEVPKFAASQNMQPPLFYWLGHFVAKISSEPFALRSISLVVYVIMIGFVCFFLKELHLASRVFLCLALILSPFSENYVTEFRPYALAALSILVSSVFLYRALINPDRWSSVVAFATAAIILQYSLTLNCFVLGLQMCFIWSFVALSLYKSGMLQTIKHYKYLIIVAVFLCLEYAVFLTFIFSKGKRYKTDPFLIMEYLKALLSNGEKFVKEVMFLDSWLLFAAIGFSVVGIIIGLRRQKWLVSYLLSLLGGQLLFSTYMTFSKIHWFSVRYLVASYVAFAVLCALGVDYLFKQNKQASKKLTLPFIILLLLIPLYRGINKFYSSLNTPLINPSVAAIEKLRCNNVPTIVLGDPGFISKIPDYAYRNDPQIIVPDYKQTDVEEVVSSGGQKKYCFILQELRWRNDYNGIAYQSLSSIPDYKREKHPTTPGKHVPNHAWLFVPK